MSKRMEPRYVAERAGPQFYLQGLVVDTAPDIERIICECISLEIAEQIALALNRSAMT